MGLKALLKQLLNPARSPLGKLVNYVQLNNTVIYKAAAFIAADKIEGDYLEFGVYRGGSFITAFRCLQEAFSQASTANLWNTKQDCVERTALWQRLRFFAFDSFRGLPKPAGPDALSRDFVEGKFSCSEDEFRKTITAHGVPPGRVITVPGWYQETLNPQTLNQHALRSAAIVYIDCDLYASAKAVLDFVTPILVDGSILIFDDWFNFKGNPKLGEQRACSEWLTAHPDFTLSEYQKEGPWKNSFIVHRPGAAL